MIDIEKLRGFHKNLDYAFRHSPLVSKMELNGQIDIPDCYGNVVGIGLDDLPYFPHMVQRSAELIGYEPSKAFEIAKDTYVHECLHIARDREIEGAEVRRLKITFFRHEDDGVTKYGAAASVEVRFPRELTDEEYLRTYGIDDMSIIDYQKLRTRGLHRRLSTEVNQEMRRRIAR